MENVFNTIDPFELLVHFYKLNSIVEFPLHSLYFIDIKKLIHLTVR